MACAIASRQSNHLTALSDTSIYSCSTGVYSAALRLLPTDLFTFKLKSSKAQDVEVERRSWKAGAWPLFMVTSHYSCSYLLLLFTCLLAFSWRPHRCNYCLHSPCAAKLCTVTFMMMLIIMTASSTSSYIDKEAQRMPMRAIERLALNPYAFRTTSKQVVVVTSPRRRGRESQCMKKKITRYDLLSQSLAFLHGHYLE